MKVAGGVVSKTVRGNYSAYFGAVSLGEFPNEREASLAILAKECQMKTGVNELEAKQWARAKQ